MALPQPLNSHRFWMLIAGCILGLGLIAVVLNSSAEPNVQAGAVAALGWALKTLIGKAIESDGSTRMGGSR